MKLEINDVARLKKLINSLPNKDKDIFISEGIVRVVGNSAMLPMPKAWIGKKVNYIVTTSLEDKEEADA